MWLSGIIIVVNSLLISEVLGLPKRVMTMLQWWRELDTMDTRYIHNFCSAMKRLLSMLPQQTNKQTNTHVHTYIGYMSPVLTRTLLWRVFLWWRCRGALLADHNTLPTSSDGRETHNSHRITPVPQGPTGCGASECQSADQWSSMRARMRGWREGHRSVYRGTSGEQERENVNNRGKRGGMRVGMQELLDTPGRAWCDQQWDQTWWDCEHPQCWS